MSDLVKLPIDDMVVFSPGLVRDINLLEWHPHARFDGVRMKDLIMSEQTEGRYSMHLVEVKDGFSLKPHVHEGQWEIHEVISGNGLCTVGEENLRYFPGAVSIIPANMKHSVITNGEDLLIVARFIPAAQ